MSFGTFGQRLAAGAIAALLAVPASAGCQLNKYFELPVTMAGRRPIVTVQINGRDARFILDSGAFFSTIAKANALEYGLAVRPVAPGVRLKGIGGNTSLGVATAQELRIAGQSLPRIEFAVGGSDTGYAGLLGQNILGLADAEYDLPHGIVRIMKSAGCSEATLAYWAGQKPVTVVEIQPMAAGQRHTIGTVKVNGTKLRATFDTGATTTMMTLAAARRLGITPESPGVSPNGFAGGLGQGRVPVWRARFNSIEIGGEAIPTPEFQIADLPLADFDMLIGIDFFLSHRIYVDNQRHRMFITYEGGPVFGFTPKRAVDSTGTAIDLTDTAEQPVDAAGYSRRGALFASNRKFDAAIADFDKALSLAPTEVHYLLQRALARLANRQPLLGAADIDRAIAIAPNNGEARMMRARMRLGARDPAGALTDLKVADGVLAPTADQRLQVAAMYDAADSPESAMANYDLWLHAHPEDRSRAAAFNGRCWARALLDRDLDKALGDCDTALRLQPREGAFLDSRALVRLRRGELDKALADYDAAVTAMPRNAWPLYARSLVHRRLGNIAQADTDRAAALALNPRVAERAKTYRLE